MKLQHVTPESVGVPSQAVLDLLDEFYRQGVEMHGLMLLRHGQVYAEGHWAPYNAQTPHILFSFSKSLTSTAIGFAVQEGILSLEDKLVDLFPDKVPENPSENLQACCVRDLLMMACGHAKEIDWVASSSDWVSQFLEDPFVYQPGTHFLYNTAGTNMLSAIITRKTGLTLTQFLQPRLFDPLEMGQVFCQPLADGTEMGGAGMYLTLEAMARFTQFVANKGRWEGKQLLNAAWFEEATAKHIENLGPGWDGDPDWHAGYCYQFWRCDKPGIFRGDGAYGQYGIVLEPQDAVVVIQGCTVQLQKVLNAVWDKLLPALGQEPLPQDNHGFHRLQKRLERLELNPMLGTRNPGAEASLDGAVYLPDAPTPGLLDLVDGAATTFPLVTPWNPWASPSRGARLPWCSTRTTEPWSCPWAWRAISSPRPWRAPYWGPTAAGATATPWRWKCATPAWSPASGCFSSLRGTSSPCPGTSLCRTTAAWPGSAWSPSPSHCGRARSAPKPRCTGSSNLSTNSKEGVENTPSFFTRSHYTLGL